MKSAIKSKKNENREDTKRERERKDKAMAASMLSREKNREVAKNRHDVAHGNSQGRSISPPIVFLS